jgi:C2H2-type zinc finger protein/C2H2 type zinc finger protein
VFPCAKCEKPFGKQQSLAAHLRFCRGAAPKALKAGKAAVKCAVCGEVFARYQALGGHMSKHGGKRLKSSSPEDPRRWAGGRARELLRTATTHRKLAAELEAVAKALMLVAKGA